MQHALLEQIPIQMLKTQRCRPRRSPYLKIDAGLYRAEIAHRQDVFGLWNICRYFFICTLNFG